MINDINQRSIIIIDFIGIHSGMHYYHNSILTALENEFEIKIFSNYQGERTEKFFSNIFVGNIFYKIIKLLYSIVKFNIYYFKNKKNIYVYNFYGSKIDRLFVFICLFLRVPLVLDIHDVFYLDFKGSKLVIWSTVFMFHRIKNVIIHCEKIQNYMVSNNLNCNIYYFPLPKVILNVPSILSPISEEVTNSVIKNKFNILFFGHIRLSKGIDNLFQNFNSLDDAELISKVHIIVAGNDTQDIIKKNNLFLESKISNTLILRHITDKELVYLFSNVNIIILPYKQISQSAVLEMAVKFKKPVILSDIDYFKNFLTHYPSFGEIFNFEHGYDFDLLLERAMKNISFNLYYKENDLERYFNNYDPVIIRRVFENIKL